MTDPKDMTVRELTDALWDEFLVPWLGSSLGAFVALGSVFWRFVMRPWRVLVDYGGGDIVWTQRGRDVPFFNGPTPPPIPMEDNIIPLCVAIIGLAVIWASNIRRSAIVREIRRRTHRSEQ